MNWIKDIFLYVYPLIFNMFKEVKYGIYFFVIGLFILIFFNSFSITGNVIFKENSYFSIKSIIGIIFISLSFIFFMSRKSLDAIVIPTGAGEWDSSEKMYS